MDKINEEYMVMTKNRQDDRIDKNITLTVNAKLWVLELKTSDILSQTFSRPLEFNFAYFKAWEKQYGKITKLDFDFIYDSTYGLIISTKHKEHFIKTITHDDLIFHKIVIIGEREKEENELSEGYWLMPTPPRPLDWMNLDNCLNMDYEIEKYVKGCDDIEELDLIKTIELNSKVIRTPLEQRQFFNIATYDNKSTVFDETIIHNSLIPYLKEHDKKEQLRFIDIQTIQDTGYVPIA